jgi:hypothetical protein
VEAIEKTDPVPLKDVKRSSMFVRPASQSIATPTLTWIRYQKKTKDVTRVMKSLGVNTPREAGEGTFDIYLNNEIA